ncbi:MAG: immune inhibitor A [Dehalococcoidia bacterium]|nr:immune inhibitor A [Dehalococcoidia bacterium]
MKLHVAAILVIMVAMLACGPEQASIATPSATAPAFQTATPTVTFAPTPTPIPTATATAAVAPTPTGTPTATPTATATPTPKIDRSLPPDLDLYALAQRLVLKTREPIPRVLPIPTESYKEGSRDTFNVTDIAAGRVYQVNATLRLVTNHAYWYVDDNVTFDIKALTGSAKVFEEKIRPRITQALGNYNASEAGSSTRLTILHTPLRGVAGYYSASDAYPKQVHPYSNEREMLYMDTAALALGSDSYLGTLAHEFTHSLQFWADPTEETWVNEGLAEFGRMIAGYPPAFERSFLESPQTSLTVWPVVLAGTAVHYGAASLFMDYLAGRYGADSLRFLMEEPANGARGVDAYLAKVDAGNSFQSIFADWVVANYLDDPAGGIFSYPSRGVRVAVGEVVNPVGIATRQVPQYSAIYLDMPTQTPRVTMRFQGQKEVPLFAQDPPVAGSCWWSNGGDSIDTTLTRRLKLPSVSRLTLDYFVWYSLEKGWDFAYVEVSADNGVTWDLLQGEHTSPKDTGINAYGPGYTGSSGGWLSDRVDLTPYAGKEALLRFEYVTDESIHGPGLCVTGITIPEAGLSPGAADEDGAWDARGFIQTNNRVPQSYVVRLIEQGAETRVRTISLDENQAATFTIDGLGDRVKRAILVVAGVADYTTLPASFQLEVVAPTNP